MAQVLNKGFSIVICTHNGEKKLTPTLKHVAALYIPENCLVEVILVNNASSDNTRQHSENLWEGLDNPFPLRVINEPRAGKGHAVETGYDAAQYAYIVTVDDDNWLREDYLINADNLIQQHPDVGIFQAGNTPVFECEPPPWIEPIKNYFVIGSPVQRPGYFAKNYYGVWGAGMIIKKADWQYLRSLGFAALTSKVPGKAAGEDVELAIALLLAGKKIFYSDTLHYKHYMPASRVQWENLKKNFATFGYTDYYFSLYAMILDAYEKDYTFTTFRFRLAFYKHWLKLIKSQGFKKSLDYFFKKEEKVYQLKLKQYYSSMYWFSRLAGKALKDAGFIESWMLPLLKQNPNGFKM